MNSRPSAPWLARATALTPVGRLRPNRAMAAPMPVKARFHSSMEPSCEPQVAVMR